MNTFTSMNSLRNEFMTKKRSKDMRETSANFQRMVRESLTLVYFLARSLNTINEVLKMKNRVNTAVKLSEEERKILENIAREYDLTISDVMRIAIKEYVKKYKNTEVVLQTK